MEVRTHFQQKTCRVQNGWKAGWLDVLGSPRWKKSSCHGMCFKANQVVHYLTLYFIQLKTAQRHLLPSVLLPLSDLFPWGYSYVWHMYGLHLFLLLVAGLVANPMINIGALHLIVQLPIIGCHKVNLSCGKSFHCLFLAAYLPLELCAVFLSAYHVGLSGMIDSKSRHFRGDPHLGALLGPLHMVHGFQIAV